jgi:uncharacterized iron-regulated protein
MRAPSVPLLVAALGLAGCVRGAQPHAAVRPSPAASKGALDPALPPADAFAWRTKLDRDAPLVGRIWDVARGGFTTADAVYAAAQKGHYVLLGEKHDNPDHHRLQARVLEAMVASGRRPAVAFEMIEADRQQAVDRFLATAPSSAAGLGAAVGWETSGWPPWPEYEPIAEVAIGAHLAIVAANLPHAVARAVVHEGAAAMDAATFARVGLDRPLAPADEAALEQEMRDSHCGMLPEARVAPMALAQRARDATMADHMIGADGGQGAVLVAGAGHVLRGRGVPLYLRARRPEASIVTIAFAEVDREVTDPRAYAKSYGAETLPFDFVWFTPRATDEDPCAGFRAPAK